MKFFSKQKNIDPSEAILIASDPRSGSTWLSEILNTIPKSLVIDEPLHLEQSPELKNLKFYWRQHIPKGTDWEEARDYFRKLFSGKLINPYSSKGLFKTSAASQLIVKTIRAKLLLPWLCKAFDFKYKPIVLVRHPMAVIASLKNHHAFDYPFKPIDLTEITYSEVLNDHQDFLESLRTNAEQQLAWWCISNKYLSDQTDPQWLTVKYEDLITDYEGTLRRIFNTWDLDMPKTLLNKKDIPSASTEKKQIEKNIQLLSWKEKLTKEEKLRYQQILDHFKINYNTLYT